MAIVWRDGMSIDRGIIDADHKCLIDLVNQIDVLAAGATTQAAMAHVLAQLDAYARAHFGREEQLQIAARFTYARAHHQRHRALTRTLNSMRAENQRRLDPNQMAALHARIRDFLHDWLLDHILHADILMKPFVAVMATHARDAVSLVEIVRSSETQKPAAQVQPNRQMPLPTGSVPRWR